MTKKAISLAGILVVAALAGLLWYIRPDLFTVTPLLPPSSNKLSVTASFYPLYFFATEIGGDQAEVYNITPPGTEPHEYEPTPQDLIRLHSSRLFILNGAGLEPWSKSILADIQTGNDITIITTGDQLATRQIDEDGQKIPDPHVWLSPLLAASQVETILRGFLAADPANAALYTANANSLTNKLKNLDARYQTELSRCNSKNIITAHTAFGYLASQYGLNQVAIAGLSPEAEPSPRQLADVADFAKKNKVTHIFFESLVSPKLSQTIAREVGAQTLVLNPLEGLTKDEVQQGKNYFTVMADNLSNLKIALQCQ